MKRWLLLLAMATPLMTLTPLTAAVNLTPTEKQQVGRMVWKNECAGTVEGLVSWNKGEGFPSLGIGHFIWYPEGKRGRFDESFPRLVQALETRGVAMPGWTKGAAPWPDAAAMNRDKARVGELRRILAEPKALEVQTEFLIRRLDEALPKMLKEAPAAERARVKANFEAMSGSARGCFAMIDYVNFKGEGVLESERYKGRGWGLLQVLAGMRAEGGDPVKAFSASAARVLEQRVKNAPSDRGEGRWLPGWKNRVGRY